MKYLTVAEFFEQEKLPPLLDVRSPAEYGQGHVPSAKNLPLFDNEERAEVGTLYKQKSREAAMMRGLELAGRKMTGYVSFAKKTIPGRRVAVHCWRGGMRSSSIGTLLEFMGYEVEVLTGGYKAYRNFVLNNFLEKKLPLIVLGGKTGSGKTDILHSLRQMGEQVIDLEGLANHRGSAFGALGMEEQPTVEQFENNLFEEFRHFDASRRVWVENESRSVGRCFVPDGLWQQMLEAVFLEIEVPIEVRIERLLKEYGHFKNEELVACLEKITKRMGGQNVKAARKAFAAGNPEIATGIALDYYDRAYSLSSSKKGFSKKHLVPFDDFDCQKIAEELVAYAEGNILLK